MDRVTKDQEYMLRDCLIGFGIFENQMDSAILSIKNILRLNEDEIQVGDKVCYRTATAIPLIVTSIDLSGATINGVDKNGLPFQLKVNPFLLQHYNQCNETECNPPYFF